MVQDCGRHSSCLYSGSLLSQEVSSPGRPIGQEGQVEYSKGGHLGLVLQICGYHFSNRAGPRLSWLSWLSYLSWFSWLSWRGFVDLGSLGQTGECSPDHRFGGLDSKVQDLQEGGGVVKVMQTIFLFGFVIVVLKSLDTSEELTCIKIFEIQSK